ncbi:MAG: RhuM family protein [Bacteroidales bacterium]
MNKAEIIFYQADDTSTRLEVRVEDDTVWLNQHQMIELFNATKQNISLHINNIYKEEELQVQSTVKEYLTVQQEGNRQVSRKITYYSLDVIISVGYRVKSKRGTQFRIWANKILKDYLLKGHILNHRLETIENKISEHDLKLNFLINSNIPPQEGIFFDGQIFDAHYFVSGLIKSAEKSLILIDNYIDESVLLLFSKKNRDVRVIIYTSEITRQLKLDIQKFNTQYSEITVKRFNKSHDRFLIIDYQAVYHIGASLKDLGKKWFAFSKINLNARDIITRLIKNE